jgi:GntR family transcriptional regulator, galactonate operon transcriptional repressor
MTQRPPNARRSHPSAPLRNPPTHFLHSDSGCDFKGIHGKVTQGLGQSIVRGVYPPGSTLPREPDLMTLYGASRTSIREAVKVLGAKGLVESRQRLGTRVRARSHWNMFDTDVLQWHSFDDLDSDILRDLIEMRQLVEPPAARLAAARATLDDLALIGERCEDMRLAMGDMAAYALFHASHNTMLRRFAYIVAGFLEISFRIQQQALDSREHRIEDDCEHHYRLYRAIDRGDAGAAEKIMMDLILDGKASLQRARRRRWGDGKDQR